MIFTPEKYSIADEPGKPFIDTEEIRRMLELAEPTREKVDAVIAKALSKKRLSMQETALLLNAEEPAMIEAIQAGARKLKEEVYGKRIVLFAPLYVGNYCSNNCTYCGFRVDNPDARRRTLSRSELEENVMALEENGQKRLILVFGEHRSYSPQYIADTVKTVYSVKKGNGEIRRVNINAAPLDTDGFRQVKEAGIGTYQIFQETYCEEKYREYHTKGKKSDYSYRLTSLDRALEAGLDDVGIGALFGLYEWKFEVMGLVRHTNHLEACFRVGPHTISFPRLNEASGNAIHEKYQVSDEEFLRLVSVLRLAVPYTGLILTAREEEHVRALALEHGCTQMDAGTRIELGAYAKEYEKEQNLRNEQFRIHDNRSLHEVMEELVRHGYIPSFCTACYRKGRTGEHFMEFSVNGFIKRCCTPNALLTLAEYLEDYADDQLKEKGWRLIAEECEAQDLQALHNDFRSKLKEVKNGKRDLNY